MADTKDTTKIEVVGTCVKVLEPDPQSKYPKFEVWIETDDGKYKNVLPFEAGAKYAEKFKPRPVEGDTVRCSGYVSGRPSAKGDRCYVSVRLAFMRVEGVAGRTAQAPATQSNDAPPPADNGDPLPF